MMSRPIVKLDESTPGRPRAAVEQRTFWTPEWQAKEREADEAIAEGRVRIFDTMEEMLEFLDAQ